MDTGHTPPPILRICDSKTKEIIQSVEIKSALPPVLSPLLIVYETPAGDSDLEQLPVEKLANGVFEISIDQNKVKRLHYLIPPTTTGERKQLFRVSQTWRRKKPATFSQRYMDCFTYILARLRNLPLQEKWSERWELVAQRFLRQSIVDKGKLRILIAERFTDEDIRTLCFDLDIKYQNLSDRGQGIPIVVRKLINYCRRRGRLLDLVERVHEERPKVPWLGIGKIPRDGTGPKLKLAPMCWLTMSSVLVFIILWAGLIVVNSRTCSSDLRDADVVNTADGSPLDGNHPIQLAPGTKVRLDTEVKLKDELFPCELNYTYRVANGQVQPGKASAFYTAPEDLPSDVIKIEIENPIDGAKLTFDYDVSVDN